MNKFLLSNYNLVRYVIDGLMLIIFLCISPKIVRKIYEKDFTYKSLLSISKGLKFSEIMDMKGPKKKISIIERLHFLRRIESSAREKFLRLDEQRAIVINSYIFLKFGLLPVLLLFAIPQGSAIIVKTIIIYIILIFYLEFLISRNQKAHERVFENYSYRIFKFINNQREAGVPTQKLITKLHLSVRDEKLKKRLISFAAEYIAKNNYEEAFRNNIMRFYSSADARFLDSALRQGLNVGDKYSVTDEAEALMFEKYIAYIDYETEKRKVKMVFIAMLFAITLLGLIGYPLVLDMIKALSIIFSNN